MASSENALQVMGGDQRLWVTIALMSSTIMQVLDTTIVNVALPHIQGQLGATPAQIGWVLTSYIVASGIFMPLTGYLTDRLGQQRYLLVCIAGFTLFSALCGLATSFNELVLFRILQGVFGAGLVPMAQSIMVQVFPLHERGRAMAIWSIGVMVGPILGPTLGGWLTEVLNWRWNFYINVPVGLISALIAWKAIPQTEPRPRKMDWSGFLLMIMALGGLQMVLDRGTAEDWFYSNWIRGFTLVSVVGFIGFIWHSLTPRESPLFDLRMFNDRNFTTASLLLLVFGLGLYGTMILMPLLLENLLHYPAATTGLLLAPRGLASMVSMQVAGRLVNKVDSRKLIASGILLFSVGSLMATQYNLQIDTFWIVVPALFQGFGLGLVLVPLSTLAYSTLEPRLVPEAVGVFSLMRTLGQALGISAVTMLVSRHTQQAWHHLGGQLTSTSAEVGAWLGESGLTVESPQAAYVLAMELARQSQMLAFVDAFIFVGWAFVAVLPLLVFMQRQRLQG